MRQSKNKIKWGIITGFLLLGLWFLFLYWPVNNISLIEDQPEEELKTRIEQEFKEDVFIDYSLKQEQRNIPLVFIIDNFSQDWPPQGINQAAIIYEAPVEADITRLLVIFDLENLPQTIGPIRSARPYFAEWAEEYQGLFIHAGGSPEFLQKADNYNFFRLDEISYNGGYFYREQSKDPPHNLYINKNNILQAIKDKGWPTKLGPGFIYWSNQSSVTNLTDSVFSNLIVKINYREPVVWQYDKETDFYFREQNNQPFLDALGNQVKAKNVVIQKTKINILDSVGRRFIKTEEEGEALIFQEGNLINGYWKNNGERTLWYDKKNQEIEFLPGNIWVNVVSLEHEIIY